MGRARGASVETAASRRGASHAELPACLRRYVQERGPYMYHVTSAANAQRIAGEGLRPDQASKFTDHRRPDHVYLADLASAYNGIGYWGDTVVAVDVRELDGARVHADEEWDRTDEDGNEHGWEWIAQNVPDLDSPANVAASLESGALAYEGVIPPAAVRVLDPGDELHPAHPVHD